MNRSIWVVALNTVACAAYLQAWIDLDQQGKYPTTEYCMQYNPDNTNCDYNCQNTDSELQKGHFVYLRMQNVWEVQEHIRMWGSVVTRLDIYSDFKEFFKKNPGGVYPGPGEYHSFLEVIVVWCLVNGHMRCPGVFC